MPVRKYVTYTNVEKSLPGGQQDVESRIEFIAPEDGTIVGILVEGAISSEPLEPALGYEKSNVVGWARLRLTGAGLTGPTSLNQNSDLDAVGGSGNLNDADNGDTWAITPFAVASGGHNTGTASFGSNDRWILAPKTARKMRRQDNLTVQILYSNGGEDQAVLNECVTATLFYRT